MATTISIEFTDAQWTLVEEHYPNNVEDEGGNVTHKAITKEELAAALLNMVRQDIINCVRNSAVKTATASVESCFDV